MLKRHDHRLRDAAALAEEHRFAAHLAKGGLPVATPLQTTNGLGVIAENNWTYEAFTPLPGLDRYGDVQSWSPFSTTADAHAAGAALARLHRASTGFDRPGRSARPLISSCRTITQPDLLAALSMWIPRQPGLTAALAQRPWQEDIARDIVPLHARLIPLLTEIVPLWGHGDWHGSNLIWDGDNPQVSGVFDFGMADRTCAAFDLAVAIERSMIAWLNPDHAAPVAYDDLTALIGGYGGVAPLRPAERALVTAFLPLVHVEFALTEVAYYAALLGDPASADVAYHTYLLGHAQWFASAQGKTLLRRLSAMLDTLCASP